ncbi:hypothetical protein [Vibrio sp. MEBiC08052]|uniref:hypothetical protein n=1 Tax=Vibrio sp. MEBiC08052 TaxID=1761910 RepID=UPI000740874C|nr:hypothetical protein [Vibrio sp. MEBiC08052]KUI99942.1 hypothetical protein VRK_06550 [Vibrio sp. MEBiC08052]
MKYFLLLVFAASFSVNANVWDTLKDTPATKYDIGRVYFDIGAYEMSKTLEGKDVGKTHYEFSKVTSLVTDGKLGLKFSYQARGKYIKKEDCDAFLSVSRKMFPSNKIVNDIWPELDDSHKKEIVDSLVFQADLMNKDNSSVLVECR